MSGLAIIHSLDGLKYYGSYMDRNDLEQLLVLGLFALQGFIKPLSIVTLSRKSKQIKSILTSAYHLEKATCVSRVSCLNRFTIILLVSRLTNCWWKKKVNMPTRCELRLRTWMWAGCCWGARMLPNYIAKERNNSLQFVSYTVPGIVVLMSVLRALFATLTLEEWTPRRAILQRSYEMAYNIFLWQNKTFSNETVLHSIDEQFGTELSFTNFVLGCSGMFLDLCGLLQFYASSCLMLAISVSMCSMIQDFNRKLNSQSPDQGWKYFGNLQSFCRDVEDVFGMSFKLFHLNNTMIVARFLLFCFIKGKFNVFLALTFLDTILVLITYFAAGVVSNKVSVILIFEGCKTWFWRVWLLCLEPGRESSCHK